jgi:hypothetical protein
VTTTDRQSDLRVSIRAAATPTARRDVMRRARDEGLLHLIPERWRVQAIEAFLDSTTITAAASESEQQQHEPAADLADYSADKRKEYAKKGWAIGPDGAYPIANVADLRRAIKAYGRSKPGDRAKVRRHIIKRARGLKQGDLIPQSWRSASLTLEETLRIRAEDFSSRHPNAPMSLARLRTVYLRGVSDHATTASTTLLPHQVGMARVNTFLRFAAGDPSASTRDSDLLARN